MIEVFRNPGEWWCHLSNWRRLQRISLT